MELSGSNIKKFLIFLERELSSSMIKKFFMFFQKKGFLIFQKTEPSYIFGSGAL